MKPSFSAPFRFARKGAFFRAPNLAGNEQISDGELRVIDG
jgi:hypothetical protein